MEDILLPKYMKGDMVRTLDTGEGFHYVERVIPVRLSPEVTLFNYELRGGIVIGEDSITDRMEDLAD